MRRRQVAACAAFGVLVSTSALGWAEGQSRLPLRAVRFYEVGVGYFERKGQVDRNAALTLPLPTAHLDDALKSLVVLSKDGKARVAAVEFESTVGAELGRALAGMEGETNAPLDWARVVRSLKGADVSVRTRGESIRGRLVDVLDAESDDSAECIERSPTQAVSTREPAKGGKACEVVRSASLVVLSEGGAVRRFRAAQVVEVVPSDAGLARRMRTALGAIAPRSDQLPRGVRILGTPGTDVTLGYVSETPIWRSTYRVVFGAQKAQLQGWALIHNDTDEDWKGVSVELVNGKPDAFMYPLAAPRYARRELVTPDNALSTVPQLLELGSPDRQWTGHAQGGLGLSGVGEGGGGRGEGLGLGSVGTIGHGSGTGTASGDKSSTELEIGSLAGMAGATGVEAEALFRYSLPNAIDLRAHGSALVPFVTKTIAASRVTWFGGTGQQGRSAARLKNETGQTLPEGTVSFFSDGGFSGEALVQRMKPDDMRVLGFGDDPDVSLTATETIQSEDVRAVTLDGGAVREHYARKKSIACSIENRSGLPREVLFSLQVVDNARVEGADGLEYDTQEKLPLARFAVARKIVVDRSLAVEEALSRSHPLGQLTAATLERLAAAPKIAPATKQWLAAAQAQLRSAERFREESMRLVSEHRTLDADIQRLRTNLAVAGTGKEASTFRERLLAAEDRLRVGRERLARAQLGEAAAIASAHQELGRLPRTRS